MKPRDADSVPGAGASGPPTKREPETTLRGATLVSAPFTLLGAIAAAVAVVSTLWIFGSGHGATPSAWATLICSGLISVAGFAAARGCRVRIEAAGLRDIVAWWTVYRTHPATIQAIRVRRGPWRVFEMELEDGARRVVLGAGPVQFPAHLLPGARERDLAAIDAMLGEVPV